MLTTRVRGFTLALAGVCVLAATTAQAAGTPEQAEHKCQKGRYDAAAKYVSCHQKLMGKYFGGAYPDPDAYFDKFLPALSKCRVKYTTTWANLEAKAAGTGAFCENVRYDTTSAPGTVIDRLTGLQWAQTTNDGTTVLDKDNTYTWSTGGADANGSAFTTYLLTLNLAGLGGQYDWRLPTLAELQTIVLEPYPCALSPCIDQGTFGPTAANSYWSATTSATDENSAWFTEFTDGYVDYSPKLFGTYVRAVRAGL